MCSLVDASVGAATTPRKAAEPVLVAGIVGRFRKVPTNASRSSSSIIPAIKPRASGQALPTKWAPLIRPSAAESRPTSSAAPGSLADRTGQADVKFKEGNKPQVLSNTKHFEGGFATEGIFAFTQQADSSTWQAAADSTVKGLLESGRLKRLGSGDYGSVYLAHDGTAYKVGTGSPQEIMRAVALSKLGLGPKVYLEKSLWRPRPAGATQGFMVLATEQVKGVTLEKLPGFGVASGSAASKTRIFEKITSAIAKYHSLGWTHNDLSTKNIMIQRDTKNAGPQVMIIDNGKARSISKMTQSAIEHAVEGDVGSIYKNFTGMFPGLSVTEQRTKFKSFLNIYRNQVESLASAPVKNILLNGVRAWEAKNFDNR